MASQRSLRPFRHSVRATRIVCAVGPTRQRQHGAFAVMAAPVLIMILGFCGLAIEMGQLYNRKVDMQGVARAAALAAARELDGTPEGIAAAKAAAQTAVSKLRYRSYTSGVPVTWRDEALSFSTSPARNGTWVSSVEAGGSSGQAAGLFFARVDTAGLDATIGTVETLFIRVLDSSLATIPVSDSVVAGKTSLKVTPIGICAMSAAPAAAREAARSNGTKVYELVQYGFRRGVSYDLMRLNPHGTDPRRFMINPLAGPGTNDSGFSDSALVPFVCSGSIWLDRLTGGTIRVSELPNSSPLAALRAALNTRFDNYTGTACDARGAAPDINIKSYAYDQASVVSWMTPAKGSASAASTTINGRLETVADLSTAATPETYGPLWAYARAVKLASATSLAEPRGGYTFFEHTDWSTLYPSGPTTSGYPGYPSTPYFSGNSASGYYQPPRTANRPMQVPSRRVLNIPLLSCTAASPSGTNAEANILAIGRFFMTVPATNDSLIAEFAGSIPPHSVPGHVELFP